MTENEHKSPALDRDQVREWERDATERIYGTTVHHPQHYGGDTPYEVIKVLEHWLTPEQMYGFNIGNTIKYAARAGKKGERGVDLAKALWYLNRAIAREHADELRSEKP